MSLECSLSVSGSGSNGQSNGNDTQREKDSMRELGIGEQQHQPGRHGAKEATNREKENEELKSDK